MILPFTCTLQAQLEETLKQEREKSSNAIESAVQEARKSLRKEMEEDQKVLSILSTVSFKIGSVCRSHFHIIMFLTSLPVYFMFITKKSIFCLIIHFTSSFLHLWQYLES